MARRHGPGRGTRHQRGAFSGTTFTTNPSGVTIDKNGIDSGGGSQLAFNGGNTAWAGSSLSITHGFSTLTGFSANYMHTGVSPGYVVTQDNGVSTKVSAAVYMDTESASALLSVSGGTVFWMACGTI